ncbi:MAG TPA: Hsp70 family protein, partial [Kofleriaceae bacterium]|nr:Hsp70 family protein [Kofleriaceae bacterium]
CEQLAAAILAKTRDLAERRFGGRVKRAVMSVPASATREYVAALMRAARLAHFEIGQIVSEPIAGSLALGLHGTSARRRLLVCDFGGGTFDVSAIVQEGLKFSPVATAGEEFLGGDDLDSAMAGAISHRIFRNTKFNMLDDRVRHAQLVQRCESVKRTLSTQATARLTMRDAFIEKGEHRALDVVMERSWVEPFWLPLVQRAVDCVSTALARARWSADSVEQIVLIGGSSTVPMYRAALVAAFGADRVASTPLAGIAVGMGAALVTAKYVAPGGIVPVLAPPSIDDDIPIEICG